MIKRELYKSLRMFPKKIEIHACVDTVGGTPISRIWKLDRCMGEYSKYVNDLHPKVCAYFLIDQIFGDKTIVVLE